MNGNPIIIICTLFYIITFYRPSEFGCISTVFQSISDFEHCLNILKHISSKNHYADMTIHTDYDNGNFM